MIDYTKRLEHTKKSIKTIEKEIAATISDINGQIAVLKKSIAPTMEQIATLRGYMQMLHQVNINKHYVCDDE